MTNRLQPMDKPIPRSHLWRTSACRVLIYACLFCLAIRAQSATWYVDKNATGANNGASWANAWRDTTSIVWASISAGDTIYLSGGISGLSYAAFTTGKSGVSGSRINILRSSESGRNGTVTLASPVQVPNSYITIDGITWDGIVMTCDSAAGSGGGGSLYVTGDNFEVKHLKFVGNYVLGNSDHTISGAATCDTMLIQYCDFYKTTGEDHINWRGNTVLTVDHCVFTTPDPPNDGSHRDLMNPDSVPGGYDLNFTHNIVYGLAANGFAMLFQNTTAVGNIHIAYNVFANSPYVVRFGSGSQGAQSIEMHNNVFYNTQDTIVSPGPVHKNNIYYGPGYVSSGLVHELSGSTDHCIWYNCGDFQSGTGNLNNTNPLFVDVNNPLGADAIPFTADDGFNLRAGSPAINAGTSTGDAVDIVGNPIVGNPDIGAYEYSSSSPSTNPVISVSPATLNFGSIPVGTVSNLVLSVRNTGGGTLSGTASVAAPFTIVSGGSYSLVSNQAQSLTVRYSPTTAGNHTGAVTFTGTSSGTAGVSGSAWAVLPGSSFEAIAGTITTPFVASANYISQPAETTLTGGGRAVYGFSITEVGDYVVRINVDAANDSADSVFLNIDAEMTDPTMIWDIPLTVGFEDRIAGWRGSGSFDSPQFPIKHFSLGVGTHQLIIRGREANVKLGRISILKLPSPPSNLRVN